MNTKFLIRIAKFMAMFLCSSHMVYPIDLFKFDNSNNNNEQNDKTYCTEN